MSATVSFDVYGKTHADLMAVADSVWSEYVGRQEPLPHWTVFTVTREVETVHSAAGVEVSRTSRWHAEVFLTHAARTP